MRVEKELGYILHQKPFSETSVLLEVFTQNYGRITLLAKGAKRRKSQFRAGLIHFKLLNFSFVGKSDLKTLTQIELDATQKIYYYPDAKQLILGLYLNELILKFLKKEDPHVDLFLAFDSTMAYLFKPDYVSRLPQVQVSQLILRWLEMALLTAVGYGVQLKIVAYTNELIIKSESYFYDPSIGFFIKSSNLDNLNYAIPGEIVLLMDCLRKCNLDNLDYFLDNFLSSDVDIFLRYAKKILRQTLDFHLAGKKIYTRELAKIGGSS